jgi:hypothetical protein
MELDEIFQYDELLEAAKKHFAGKKVDSTAVFDWFHEIGLLQYVRFSLVEKLMFRLRTDLWTFYSSQKAKPQ